MAKRKVNPEMSFASLVPEAITGVPTEAQKAKARSKAAAKPHGGKPGSATGAQSVRFDEATQAEITKQVPRQNLDKIDYVKNAASGHPHIAVGITGGRSVIIPQHAFTGELNKLALVGGSLKAVEEYIKTHKPSAKLANGVTSRDAPNASKAVADAQRAPKAAPVKAVKAAPAKKSAPASDDSRKLTAVTANPKKPGTATFTRYAAAYKVGRTLTEVLKHTTRADIDWDLKRGFIKL